MSNPLLSTMIPTVSDTDIPENGKLVVNLTQEKVYIGDGMKPYPELDVLIDFATKSSSTHAHTRSEVGLTNVRNYPLAVIDDIAKGTVVSSSYITPASAYASLQKVLSDYTLTTAPEGYRLVRVKTLATKVATLNSAMNLTTNVTADKISNNIAANDPNLLISKTAFNTAKSSTDTADTKWSTWLTNVSALSTTVSALLTPAQVGPTALVVTSSVVKPHMTAIAALKSNCVSLLSQITALNNNTIIRKNDLSTAVDSTALTPAAASSAVTVMTALDTQVSAAQTLKTEIDSYATVVNGEANLTSIKAPSLTVVDNIYIDDEPLIERLKEYHSSFLTPVYVTRANNIPVES